MKICKKDRKTLIFCIGQLIKNHASIIVDNRFGICCNLHKIKPHECGVDVYAFVEQNSKSWKRYDKKKGSIPVYPIPCEDGDNKWEGESLRYRISLLKHLRRLLKSKQYKYHGE